MKYLNTLEKGDVRVLIFKKAKNWIGVVLDFNIVEVGSDPSKIMIALDEAIRGYVLSARKAKLRPQILNQIAEEEYEDLWNKLENKKTISSPIKVHSFGRRSLSVI